MKLQELSTQLQEKLKVNTGRLAYKQSNNWFQFTAPATGNRCTVVAYELSHRDNELVKIFGIFENIDGSMDVFSWGGDAVEALISEIDLWCEEQS